MAFHNPFDSGHESFGSGMYEAAGWMAQELSPIANGRANEVSNSTDNRILPVAYNTLGADVVNALLNAIDMAPAVEPPSPENIRYSKPVADYIASQTVQQPHAPSAAEVEINNGVASGFLDLNDPEDQKLAKTAAWEGDPGQDIDPSKLAAEEKGIGHFFKQNFSMMPKQDDLQPQAYTEQDLKTEAGFDNPQVDETRKMWDTLSTMPEMVAGSDGAQMPTNNVTAESQPQNVNTEQQPAPDQQAMAEAARRQAEAAHRQLMEAQQ